MKIEHRPLAEIKPYEKNPRVNDASVDAVAESIEQFGFRQPIVVDADGVIVCGHTRWKAAQKLGLEQVPVHVARDLTSEQIRAYRIADNKTAELAEWNQELLPLELAELQGACIDWSLLGFETDELAKLLDPGVKQGLTDPDEIPEPPYELPGSSLLPLFRAHDEANTAGLRGRPIFHSHHRYASRGVVQYAVIELPRWKLTHTYHRTPVGPGWRRTRFALYDLRGGLYADEDMIDGYREVARRLMGELLAYRQRYPPYEPSTDAKGLELDAEQIRQLKSLGYVEDQGGEARKN